MQTGGVAKRYAEAVFEIARDTNAIDAWQRDLALLRQVGAEDAARQFFASPKASVEQKTAVAEGLVGKRIQPAALNLARLLIRRDRFGYVEGIDDSFAELVREYRGVAIADVTTAVEMDKKTADNVARRLGALVARKVELRRHVDPEIVGGLVARVGDYLVDGSVNGQLDRMRTHLATDH